MAIPPGVTTEISPVLPLPTTAEIVVSEITLKERASTPPNFTEEAPVKYFPLMVIVSPLCPLVGVKDVITGGLI